MRLVDVLREIASNHGKPVSHIAINWLTQQEGVTCALVGARRPSQIQENAGAGSWTLSDAELKQINRAWEHIFGGNLDA